MGSQWLPPEPKLPAGLLELMEGLTRDVLRHNPSNVLDFCTRHMQRLLEIRDGSAPKISLTLDEKIRRAQEKMRRKAEERRLKYDEAMTKHLEGEPAVTKGQDSNDLLTKSDSVTENHVLESIRVPIPVHQDLGHDKEIEISHDPDISEMCESSDNLIKSIEILDEAVIAETNGNTSEDVKLIENKFEGESNNTETHIVENHTKISTEDIFAENGGDTTNNVQPNNTESNKCNSHNKEDFHLSTENTDDDSSKSPETVANNSDINTVDMIDAQEIHTDKVSEYHDATNDLFDKKKHAEGESNGPETNSLKEQSVIQKRIERFDIAETSETNGDTTKDAQKNNVTTGNNDEEEPSYPETNCLEHNPEIHTEDNLNSDKVNEGSSALARSLLIDEGTKNSDITQTEETKQIVKDISETNTTTVDCDDDKVNEQLFRDHKNNENISDTRERNTSDSDEINLEVNNCQPRIDNKDGNTESFDKNEEKILDMDHNNINPINIVKRVSAEYKVDGTTQYVHADKKLTENEITTEVLENELKESILTPEITLKLPESYDNYTEVSEPKCEKKIVSTLAVPINNIININDGDVKHKNENPDSNAKHNLLQSDVMPEDKVKGSKLDTDSSIENKMLDEKGKLENNLKELIIETDSTIETEISNEKDKHNGLANLNIPAALIGETQVVGSHIVKNPCSLNNSQIKGDYDVLDENSESEFILKNADIDEIMNRFDSSNVAGESKTTSPEKIVETEDKIDDGNEMVKLSTQSIYSTSNVELETAAVTIQKHFRMFLFKSRDGEGVTFDDSLNDDPNSTDEEADKQLVEYQISQSLTKERRGLCKVESVLQTVNEEKSLSLSTDDSVSSAATVIQARVRGFLVRKRLDSNKTASISTPNNRSMSSEEQKEKKVLNIHIVPSGDFIRDESILESIDLSLDGSPPSSNRHPLGYDKSEPGKQLKREDAVQSVSPPTSNGEKISDETQSNQKINNGVKISIEGDDIDEKISQEDVNTVEKICHKSDSHNENSDRDSKEGVDDGEENSKEDFNKIGDSIKNSTDIALTELHKYESITEYTQDQDARSCETTPSRSTTLDTVIEIHKENVHTPELEEINSYHEASDIISRSSDDSDVVTPLEDPNSTDSDSTSKLLHSGEFHDVLLPSPTQISRSNTTVVREFTIVLGFFLLWK